MALLNPFILLLSIGYTVTWYSRCDEAGRCTISETLDSEQIYLVPGYIPLFPEGKIIPLPSNTNNSSSFSVDAIHGFSPFGKLNGLLKYECAGGISECSFSCCKKGLCADTLHSCKVKNDTIELIYILTGAVFAAFIIVYWIVYFVLGCRYNSFIVKTQKNQQQYGTVVKENPVNPVNHTIEEHDEVDEPGMRTHGSIQVDDGHDKQKANEGDDKRKKMSQAASRIAKFNENEANYDKPRQVQEEEAQQQMPIVSNVVQHNQYSSNQYKQPHPHMIQDNNQGEISISSKQEGNDPNSQKVQNINNISDNFDEVNLDDMMN